MIDLGGLLADLNLTKDQLEELKTTMNGDEKNEL